MNDRLKFYVEFPIAQTWEEAVKCIIDGGSCHQEDSNDWPNCGGFDDLIVFLENFPEEEKDEFDFSLFDVHMVPKGEEDAIAEPFKVGEMVWSSKDIERVALDNPVYAGTGLKIERICIDGTLIFEKSFKSNGKDIKLGFNPQNFIRDGKEEKEDKKVYILVDTSEGNLDMDSTFTSMTSLKNFVDDNKILWSDEDDFEEILDSLGILNDYSGTNWDYEGVHKVTGEVVYAVQISFLK